MSTKLDEVKTQLGSVVDALENFPVRENTTKGGRKTRKALASVKPSTPAPAKESVNLDQLTVLIKSLGETMVKGLETLTASHNELKDTILAQNDAISHLEKNVKLNSQGVISLKKHLDDQAEVMIKLQTQNNFAAATRNCIWILTTLANCSFRKAQYFLVP